MPLPEKSSPFTSSLWKETPGVILGHFLLGEAIPKLTLADGSTSSELEERYEFKAVTGTWRTGNSFSDPCPPGDSVCPVAGLGDFLEGRGLGAVSRHLAQYIVKFILSQSLSEWSEVWNLWPLYDP